MIKVPAKSMFKLGVSASLSSPYCDKLDTEVVVRDCSEGVLDSRKCTLELMIDLKLI